MSAATEARQAELDRVLDAQEPIRTLADELFAVADLLESQAALRTALSDLTAPEDVRRQLAAAVLKGQVSAGAVAVIQAAAGLRWASGSALAAAVERQGVRAVMHAAQAAGELDTVEEELFRFSRIVVADHGLRDALEDRTASIPGRQQLIADLLAGKALDATLVLAQRAVRAADRTFELTLESYLRLAAAQRQRAIAEVTVARPLSAEQAERLRTALSAQVGREVSLQVVVDPSVLGGVRVKLGDEVIEGTVAGRLEAAERQLN
ncbi:MAG: F0F1 ATP synthase subunit delta [Actinobacteria bacterium]|nr:F0F1 ATP synthase subunit delta [Actinomycetota bacterium]